MVLGGLLDETLFEVFDINIRELKEKCLDVVLNDPVHIRYGSIRDFHDVGPLHIKSDGQGQRSIIGEHMFLI